MMVSYLIRNDDDLLMNDGDQWVTILSIMMINDFAYEGGDSPMKNGDLIYLWMMLTKVQYISVLLLLKTIIYFQSWTCE